MNKRSSRSEYWLYFLVWFFLGIIVNLLVPSVDYIFSIAHTIFFIPVTVRRMHDINKTGWAYYGTSAAIIAGTFLLVFGMLFSAGSAAIIGVPGGVLGVIKGLGAGLILVVLGGLYLLSLLARKSYPAPNMWGEPADRVTTTGSNDPVAPINDDSAPIILNPSKPITPKTASDLANSIYPDAPPKYGGVKPLKPDASSANEMARVLDVASDSEVASPPSGEGVLDSDTPDSDLEQSESVRDQ